MGILTSPMSHKLFPALGAGVSTRRSASIRPFRPGESAQPWCECVTDFSRLEEFSSEWQQWTSASGQSNIFQHWAWARAYWTAYGETVSLFSFVVHEGNRIAGILPLVLRGETLEFLGSPESDCNDLLCDDDEAVRVLEVALVALLQQRFRWRSGVLDHLPADSRIVRSIPALPLSVRRHLQLIYQCPSPTILLDQNRTQVLDTLLNKGQLKRYDKKLQKQGCVAFRHLKTRVEIREHLDRFFHQHITRWAMKGVRSQFLQPERRAFYEAMVEEFDPRTELRFGVLELDSRPIAYHFGLQLNERLIWYKPAFDVNYWDHCPGDVLLRSLFQYARDAALREFDFSVGDEPFKYRYSNHVRQNYILHVESHPERLQNRVKTLVRHGQHVVRQKPGWKAALNPKVGYLTRFASQFSPLAKSQHPWKRFVGGLPTICRRMIGMREEVCFYASPEKAIEGACSAGIAPGSLDTLAALSVEYPDALDPATLQGYRRRLTQGDRVFIARGERGEAFVLWVGLRTEITVPELGRECRLRLGTPAMVLYDYWTASHDRGKRVPSQILRMLAEQLAENPFWIYSLREHRTRCQAIEDAGFQLRHRLFRRIFLLSFQRTRIAPMEPSYGASSNFPSSQHLQSRSQVR
jgi:CelD/BcsL family acetyltransferase involved in cellulose biosynthesis